MEIKYHGGVVMVLHWMCILHQLKINSVWFCNKVIDTAFVRKNETLFAIQVLMLIMEMLYAFN